MRRLADLLCVASLTFGGFLAWAEDAPQPAGGVRTEIQNLHNQLKDLQQRLDELERKPDGVSLRDRLEDLEKTLGDNTIAGYDGKNFFIQNPEGDYRLNFTGRIHFDGRFPTTGPSKGQDEFLFRRLRPTIEGHLAKYYEFKIEPDFSGNKVTLKDVFINWHYFDQAQVKLGNFKVPFGCEELTSSNSIRFLERSTVTTGFSPAHRLGIGLHGSSGLIGYSVGVFNGKEKANKDKGNFLTGGRVVLDLSKTESALPISIGANAAVEHDAGSAAADSFKTGLQTKYFEYNGVNSDGKKTLLGADVSLWRGPIGLVAEYITAEHDLVKGSAADTVNNRGWYVQGSYVLTGEKATAKGVKPNKNFDLANGTWGAFELAARYAVVDIDNKAFTNGFARSGSADGAKVTTAGINWYLNQNVSVLLDYVHSDFNDALADGSKGEDGVMTRVQLSF